MFYKNFRIFNMILLISKSFFKPYFIQSLSVHIHPRKLYVTGPAQGQNLWRGGSIQKDQIIGGAATGFN